MKKKPGLSKLLTLKSDHTLLKILGSLFLLFTLSFSPVLAGENFLSEKVQLKVDNVTLKDALKEIERQSNFTFLYNDALIDVNQVLSIASREQSVKELLDQILDKRGIHYTIIENQIVLTKAAKMQESKRSISGKIVDGETQSGLPGVPVLIKGTTTGTVTDLDGNFTLSVNEDVILSITYMGYVTEEIPVANRTDFNIQLSPDLISLDDVVVIGYGTIKKSDITGAVASVSAEQLQQSAVSGVDQALQGRTAGVSVTANSGAPGSAPTVRIRGVGTVNNPDPFFVVDGMPMTASEVGNLNPGDIERTEILKDASAAAIYGARAANGVVLITTKRGKEGVSNVVFDAYVGTQSLAKKFELLNAKDFITVRNAAGNPWEDSSAVVNTDWQDEIFRTAKMQNYQLQFMGGTEKMQYALIGNYYNQEGILKGSNYERYSFRLNTSADIKKWLKVGENISYTYGVRDVLSEQDEYSSVVVNAINMDPAVEVYIPDSVDVLNDYSRYRQAQRNNINNPVGMIDRNNNKIRTSKLLGNIYFDIKPIEWLIFRTNLGAEFTRHKEEVYLPEFEESVSYNRIVNQLIQANADMSTMLWENTLTFNKTIAEKHDVTLMAGYTRQIGSLRFNVQSNTQIPENEDLWFLDNGGGTSLYNDYGIDLNTYPSLNNNVFGKFGTPSDNSLISYMGRLLYTYDRKYDINASIRRDGSSKFGDNKKWGIFPSFAAGWKISEEAFMKDITYISFAKVRFGWGKLGNQEVGDYRAYSPITYRMNYSSGTAGSQSTYPGGAPTSAKNEDVQWETVKMTNIGLDLNLFQNRINLNADYFIRTTTDMLVEAPIPSLTGVAIYPLVNKGSVENRGLELNLLYKGKRGDFSYEVGGNIAFTKNEVLELGEEGSYISSGVFRASNYASRTEVGHPIASYYGYKTNGYWEKQEDIDAANLLAQQTAGNDRINYDTRFTSPGDIKFVDINGDNRITVDDRTYIGNPNPDITYGVNITLKYKIIDFTIFGQGIYGNEIFQGLIYYNESSNAYWNMSPDMMDYWTEDNLDASVPRLDMRNSNDNLRFSDRYIKNGSFFRIKNVQLGINLPSKVCQAIKVEKVRVYIAAQNLKTFSKYSGFDPEIGTGNVALDIGIDRGFYPVSRSYMVGASFTF